MNWGKKQIIMNSLEKKRLDEDKCSKEALSCIDFPMWVK